ncbi:MAG: energy transducer TonB [Luteimonas sp.]|nr:energy transducer TonB [Luteimonas sp.]
MGNGQFRETRAWLVGIGLAWLCIAGMASAATPSEVSKQIEASMLLTGTISIKADGSVSGYSVDNEDKVPDYVLASIGKWVPAWRFKPVLVDGKAAPARAKMSLRIRAEPSGEDTFSIYIAGASFGESGARTTDPVARPARKPPVFPRDVANMGGKGIVYLVLKLDRQGTVKDVVAEQVNLTVYASNREMARFRRSLAAAAVKRAWEWTFREPDAGELGDAEFWSVRVPVDFGYRGDKEVAYGQWEGYLPGPHTRASWLGDGDETGNDALASGDLHMVGSGLRLLTPLQG